jgi:uncharacterized membrane protein
MKPLINSVTIRRSAEDVFDYCSDLGNERFWNPHLVSVEALSVGPIAQGTRFRCQWRGGPVTECAYTLVDRPGHWEIYGTAKGMDIAFSGDVEPTKNGARLTITMKLLPKGLFRLFGPMIRRGFQKKEEQNLASIRAALETAPRSASSSAVRGREVEAG